MYLKDPATGGGGGIAIHHSNHSTQCRLLQTFNELDIMHYWYNIALTNLLTNQSQDLRILCPVIKYEQKFNKLC